MKKTEISIRPFAALVYNLKHPDIPTGQALLYRIFRSGIGCTIFKRLISDMSESKHPDSIIYKTDIQLARQVACSPNTVSRFRPMLGEVGFDISPQFIDGKRVFQYRFNMERFEGFIAARYGVTVEEVKTAMSKRVPKSEVEWF